MKFSLFILVVALTTKLFTTNLSADKLLFSDPSVNVNSLGGIDTLINFESEHAGTIPSDFIPICTGKTNPPNWKIIDDDGNKVTAQLEKNAGNIYNLLILEKIKTKDVRLAVKIKAVGGSEDQGGGLVWRYIDNNNYYIARYNPLENNLRFYIVINGTRKQLKTTDCEIRSGEWFTMEIKMTGNKISCSLNGKVMIEATDDTFKGSGRVGFWTKADAQTYFDDFSVQNSFSSTKYIK